MKRRVVAFGIILAALLISNTAPALAGYGAVAYDEGTRKLGFASNEETQERADEVAMRECGGSDGCKVRFRAPPKECAAFAAPNKGTAWGGSVKKTLDAAKLGALENCQKHTKDQCTILESACNTSDSAFSCSQENQRLDALAKKLSVSVDQPAKLAAGQREAVVTVHWSVDVRTVPDDLPTYFILSGSAPVRFLGTGFLALTAEARGPTGVDFGSQRNRAIVPLHNPTAQMHGSIAVKVLRAGNTELRWGLVIPTACGQKIGTEDKLIVSASTGAPRLVIQNPYDLDNPDQTVLSNDGRYRLHVFPERFRVFDTETGLLVLQMQGRQPNFSPTGRFLAAYQGGRDSRTLNVFDLEAGTTIGTVSGPALIWQNGDSVAVGGSEVFERVVAVQTLLDDLTPPVRKLNEYGVEEFCSNGFATKCHPSAWLLADNEGCNGCGAAWSEVTIGVSYDSGVVARWNRDENGAWRQVVYSLGFAISPPIPDKSYETAVSDRTLEMDRARISRLGRLAPSLPSVVLAQGRTSHAPLGSWGARASHGDAHIGRQDAGARDLGMRLMMHRTQAAGSAKRVTVLDDIRHRLPDGQVPLSNVLFDQLSDIGLKLARGTTLSNVVTSVSTQERSDGLFHIVKTLPDLEKRLGPFLGRTDGDYLDVTSDCNLLDLQYAHADRVLGPSSGPPTTKPKLIIKCADGLWSFSRGSTQYLMGQTLSIYGTDHENVYTNTYLLVIEPDKPARFIDLTSNFLPGSMPMYERGQSGFPWPGNIHRINFVAQRYLVFASPGQKTAHVFDLETFTPLGKQITLVDADLLASVQLSVKFTHLLQINTDGRLEIGRLADGQPVASGRTTDDELLVALPDGRFDGTPEGAHFVNIVFDGDRGLYSFNQFERSLRASGIVLAALEERLHSFTADVVPPPSVGLTVRSEKPGAVVLEVDAHSVAGLKELRLVLDGVPVLEKSVAGNDQKLQLELPNPGQSRTVAALTVDVKGNVSRAASRALKVEGHPKAILRVLTVGIDSYGSNDFPSLASAVADAKALRAALGNGNRRLFAEADIRPALVNELATPDAIRTGLQGLVAAAVPGDTIVFAFAGHGVTDRSGQMRLATKDASIDNLAANSVGWDEIAAMLSHAQTRVVVLLDACHAGDANFDRLAKNEAMVKALLSGVRSPILIFAASKGRETSRERDGSGVFTHAFIDALSGRSAADLNNDGLLDVSELYAIVKRDVVAATSGQQTPWLARGDLLGDFPVFERLTSR